MTPSSTPPRLLCVPGLGLDHRAWRPTLQALCRAERETAVVAALPGYGSRPVDEDDLSPTALGARLAEEWIKGMPGGVVLAGHSASCQIVTQAALLCPDRVSAVVLVGPTTDPRASSWRRITARWLRTAVWERPGQVPLLAQTYTRTGLIWMWRAMDAARREDLRAALRTLQCRVLVARGRHDRICPEPWTAELVAVARAGSASVTLDAGAHMVPLTHGELLAAVLRTAAG